MRYWLLSFLLAPLLVSCALTPDYERPELDVPEQYLETAPAGESIANIQWWELFQDEQLEALIRTALEENKDLRVALSRIEEASLGVTSARANQFPFLDITLGASKNQPSGVVVPGAGRTENYFLSGNLSYQLDLWGEYRRGTEAARADLLATEYAYRNVTITLVSTVANTYFLLRDLDQRLAISRRTLESRSASLNLMQSRFQKGVVPELDVFQAQIELAVAEATTATFERQISQTENALRILLGRNPGPVPRGGTLMSQMLPVSVPAGLPSELLQRRPDVVQAEAQLMSATALVGVAEALRYPSLSLTGRYGAESNDLSELNSNDAEVWSFGANVFGPIFNSGQLKAQADAARERVEQSLLAYEAALQQSFREVEDALVAVRTYREEHAAQVRRANAARGAARLSRARYDGGVVDYLEVLDSERTLFNAELDESETLQLYFNAVVQLYASLGGGWSPEAE